ncbi:MAG: acetyltransferase [Anaerolineae bacterium]|nr:acetyltransferase [Anaerolineae bacterium]MBT7192095.1 acetyltransferase [Anaerolineae bacterium]MBT7990171.1 acetyltransferase [Anaerolineae bacterium]
MENILILGAGGHAKVIVDIVEQEGKYNLVGIIDQNLAEKEPLLSYPLLGKEEDLPKLIKEHAIKGIIIAIGDNFIRSKAANRLNESYSGLSFPTTIHPKTAIAKDVKISEGTVIMAGVSVNPGSTLGNFCILNTNSILDHDSSLGDFSSLAPGVTVGGDCNIGNYSAIGIGATLLHGIKIGEHSVIGAASLVSKEIPPNTIAYGLPAKEIRTRKKGEKYL